MIDCKECNNYLKCDIPRIITDSIKSCNDFEQKKPQTNADRIRSLSDEELAEWFAETVGCKLCDRIGLCKGNSECKESYLQWLESEVKE